MSRLPDPDRFLTLLWPARLHPAAGPAPSAAGLDDPGTAPLRRRWIKLWPTGPRHANRGCGRVPPTAA